jgi:hypothetical protein
MLSEEEIIQLATDKAVLFKGRKKDGGPIPFHKGYIDAIKYKERIAIHSDEDVFPHELYMDRSPNQTQKELDYMKKNHKAITYTVWDRFTSAIARIWNDKNWSVLSWGTYNSKYESHPPQKYFEEEYPLFGSLEYYFKDILTDYKEKDPNAVLVHYPLEIPLISNEDGITYLDDSKMIDPVAHIYGCERVVEFREGVLCMILSEEKSMVLLEDGTQVREGIVFEFYDDTAIYKIYQTGKKSEYTFIVSQDWVHELGYLPCRKLKARPKVKDHCIIYKSHFAPAVEHLDLALLDNAYLLVSKARHAFPKWWEYATKCEYHSDKGNCDKGIIRAMDGKDHVCPSCNGSGFARSLSPFESIQLPIPDRMNPEGISGLPGGFIQPDIDSPKFLREEIERHIQNGLSILNLNVSNANAKGSEAALAKQVDREEMFSFLLKISGQIFDLFEFSLTTIHKMRYGVNEEPPMLSYPKNFAIRNESDLTIEISEAKEKGMPDVIIRELIIEYMATRFSAQENIKKVIDLVFYTDRLATLSSLEIANKKASGAVANWEDILHTSVYNFIDQKLKGDENWKDKDVESQRIDLIDMAKALADELSGKKLDPDAILADANAGVSDEEAKAKANLKGSVGGVQGLIQIQQSVSAGTTDYESAVTMLFEIYGFDDATARKLLGNPIDLIPASASVVTENG